MATEQDTFDAAYLAAQPKPIRAVMAMPTDSSAALAARQAAAVAVAKQGYLVEGKIVGWGFDPWMTMKNYEQEGYTWVNNILQPAVLPPGLNFPGLPAYDPNNPPAGSIKVSTNLADYPPDAPPATPGPAPLSYYIGPLLPGQTNEYETYDSTPNGFTVSTAEGTFVKYRQVTQGPFGPWIVQYYVKIG